MKREITIIVMAFLILASAIIPVSTASAEIQGKPLKEVLAQYEMMKRRVQGDIGKCEETIAMSQNIIALAQQKGNREAESVARQALSGAMDAKRRNEVTKSEIEQAIASLQNLMGKEGELQKARVRLSELRDDVEALQFGFKLYRDALLNLSAGLAREGEKVSEMSDRILMDGIEYLTGAALSGMLKANFKFWKKDTYKRYEKVFAHVGQLQTETDIVLWMESNKDDMDKLIEGTDLLASTVVPGWDHVKVNFKAWSTVARECISWRKINRLNKETDEYAKAVEDLSIRMKSKVGKIRCLKQCMDEYIVGCVERCS